MTLNGHAAAISAIVVIDELRICSCSWDTTVKVWNVGTGVCYLTLEGHTSDIYDMVLLLDGRISTVSKDSTTKIWNKDTGVCEIDTQVSSDNSVYRVVQLYDGRLVVFSSAGVFMLGE
jgi:WD40 repeat protein